MEEKYSDDEDEINIINTDSNLKNEKNKNFNQNTYSTNINEKSTIYDDNTLLNSDLLLPNTSSTNYIQSSTPPPSLLNQLNSIRETDEIETDNINEINDRNSIISTSRSREKSIIDILNDNIKTKLNTNIKLVSILSIDMIRDNSLSNDCSLGLSIVPSGLLSNFMKIDVNYILSPILNMRKSCFRRLSVEQIMSWQKKELTFPLLKMEQDDDKEASTQIFRNLLSYTNDRFSRKRPLAHASKFLKIVKNSNPIIKDEAYLQVYKQLHNNNKRESLMRNWKMLAILSSFFVPHNENIFYLILNFLFFELQNTNDEIIQKHINYIFVHMVKTEKFERKNSPCIEELQYIECLKSILVPIYFFNGKQTVVKIESYTTFKEVKKEIMNMLDFSTQRAMFYSIYEICYKDSGTEERFIDDNELVGDVLALWKSDLEKSKSKKEFIMFRFYLKLLIYYQYDESNNDNLSIVFYQTIYDVISGKFQLTEAQILTLAALQLSNEFGSATEKAYIFLKENHKNYIPGNYISIMSKDQWIEKIMELYTIFAFFPKRECKIEYLKLLEGNPFYQMHLFDSKFDVLKSSDNDDIIPETCILGFKPEGIVVFSKEREKITFYEYAIIKNWGISANIFVINISLDNSAMRKLYFQTGETNVIQTIMEMYGCIIAGKSLSEMQSILEERDKKFNKNAQTKRIATKYKREQDYEFSSKSSGVLSEGSSSFVFPIMANDEESL